jgi:hypothetical protein
MCSSSRMPSLPTWPTSFFPFSATHKNLCPILKGTSKHAFVVCGPEMEEIEHTTVVIDAGRNIAPPVDLEMADGAAWESWDEMGIGDSEASENPEDYAVPV